MLEKTLLAGIWAGFGLLLLTPLVVTPQTIFPFVVGKAVYTRAIIEFIFGFWALLALSRPAYRPPRSWLLLLLALGLGVATLAACFGVSVQRSLWSSYERMQGVVDLAHWFVLAVVMVSVVRTVRGWCVLLNLNLGVSLMMALLAVAQYYAVDLPFFDYQPTKGQRVGVDWGLRVFTTFGNPTYLGSYMLVNVILALGFLIRSLIPAAPPALPAAGRKRGKRRRQKRTPPQTRKNALLLLWVGRCFWGGTALLGLWALGSTGTRVTLLGLILGLSFSAVLSMFLARTRIVRLVAMGLTGVLGGVFILMLTVFFRPDTLPFAPPFFNAFKAITERKSKALPNVEFPSVQSRLTAWEAGFKGFIDKPLLGWGPENYIVVFGRYASGFGSVLDVHDSAHSKLVEELTTKGLFGLLSYLSLWACTFFVVVRAVKGRDARERVLTLCVGGTLMGYFIQSQFLFDTTTNSLQHILLLAFVANLERVGGETASAQTYRTILRHPGVRTVIVVGALALVGLGLLANQAIYSAASVTRSMVASASTLSHSIGAFKRATSAFKPLANYPRLLFFENMTRLSKGLHFLSRVRLLGLVTTEAGAAIDTEPENWRIYVALARLYGEMAASVPEYADAAQRYREKALALAPQRQESLALLQPPPRPGAIQGPNTSATGNYTLRWGGSTGASKYRVQERVGSRGWAQIGETAGLALSFSEKSDETYSYRVKACIGSDNCSGWTATKTVSVKTGRRKMP